ncbi:MAG: YggT family protein [Candidatus Hydrogenedentes bacterium]|nr:YggT family protein [Candidatus Hydrogenedentota bacterium]
MTPIIIERLLYSVFTLYMLMVLLRWLGPFLELNFHDIRLRWIASLTDPVVGLVRRILPPLGPVDFGPLATVLLLWLVRFLATELVGRSGA